MKCPVCGEKLRGKYNYYTCASCNLSVTKEIEHAFWRLRGESELSRISKMTPEEFYAYRIIFRETPTKKPSYVIDREGEVKTYRCPVCLRTFHKKLECVFHLKFCWKKVLRYQSLLGKEYRRVLTLLQKEGALP